VANRDKIASTGICKDVKFNIAGEEFILDIFVIPLVGYEMVLGIHWRCGHGRSPTVEWSNYSVGAMTMAYLGHIISEHGVAMDANKVEVVKSWPPPRTVHALHSFLGLISYYKQFIHGYGDIITPLQEAFFWSPAVAVAFKALKIALTTTPVL
jgi:hypothetical protein